MNLEIPNLPTLEECIPHRNWQRALNESFSLLTTAQPGDVICLVGPSRAGKSRLIQRLTSLLSGQDKFEQTGVLPVVAVEASNTGPNGRFSTKGFTVEMLNAVRHPLYSDPTNLESVQQTNIDRKTEHELRRALERALQHRQCRYLFIDEAQHARYATRDSLAVMDSWKCLARAGGVVLVLVGAYPMLDIIRDSPHMIGRKREVHLSRYGTGPDDLKAFGQIIGYYENKLSSVCGEKHTLLSQIELLYQGSLGCIGLLRSWLLYAASLAHTEKTVIDKRLLLQSMCSDADREVVLREISDGERMLRTTIQSPYSSGVPAKTEGSSRKRTSASSKPFQRKPRRHRPNERASSAQLDPKGAKS